MGFVSKTRFARGELFDASSSTSGRFRPNRKLSTIQEVGLEGTREGGDIKGIRLSDRDDDTCERIRIHNSRGKENQYIQYIYIMIVVV